MDYEHVDTTNPMVKKIIQTSFEIFAKNDIKKASTNLIVQTAGISRGILYHYFKDKQDLFDYLVFFSFVKSFNEVNHIIDWEDGDLIKRINELTKFRLDVIADYPYMIEFGEKYRHEILKVADPDELRSWRKRFYQENIDFSLFKSGMDMEQVMHTLKWTFRGLYKELLEKPDPNKVITESVILETKEKSDKCYALMAQAFYK